MTEAWAERTDARGKLVMVTLTREDGATFQGAARVMSKGEDEAKGRALAQAQEKAAAAA